jgi:hypothetical protein
MTDRNIYHIKFMHQDPEGSTTTVRVPADHVTNDEIFEGHTVSAPTLRLVGREEGSVKFELQEFEFLDLSKAYRIIQDSAKVVEGDA